METYIHVGKEVPRPSLHLNFREICNPIDAISHKRNSPATSDRQDSRSTSNEAILAAHIAHTFLSRVEAAYALIRGTDYTSLPMLWKWRRTIFLGRNQDSVAYTYNLYINTILVILETLRVGRFRRLQFTLGKHKDFTLLPRIK